MDSESGTESTKVLDGETELAASPIRTDPELIQCSVD